MSYSCTHTHPPRRQSKAKRLKQPILNINDDLWFVRINLNVKCVERLIEVAESLRRISMMSTRGKSANVGIECIFDSGFLPRMIQLLRHEETEIVGDISWTFLNIICGPVKFAEYCMEIGLVDAYIYLMDHYIGLKGSDDMLLHAVWGLGNLAGHGIEYRDMMVEKGVMPRMLASLDYSQKCQSNSWVLSNFLRGEPFQDFKDEKMCIPFLTRLINLPESKLVVEGLLCMDFISNGDLGIQTILDQNLLGEFMELLNSDKKNVLLPVISIISHFSSTHHRNYIQLLLDLGILDSFARLFNHQELIIRYEVMWQLAVITARINTNSQIQEIIDSNITPKIIDVLLSPIEVHEVKSECLSILIQLVDPISFKTYEQWRYFSSLKNFVNCLLEYTIPGVEEVFEVVKSIHNLLKVDYDNVKLLINSFGGHGIFENLIQEVQDEDFEQLLTVLMDLVPKIIKVNWTPQLHNKAPKEIKRIVETIHILAQVDPKTRGPVHSSPNNHFWYLPTEVLTLILSNFKFDIEIT